MRVTGKPTVLFCVGATKAGTTWLHDHLLTHPDCHMRSIKELHYFTCIESGQFDHQLKVQQARAVRMANRSKQAGQSDLAARKLRDVGDWIVVLRRRYEDIPAYLGYLTDGRNAQPLVADMTPAYALLPEERLHAMAEIGTDVRFHYLLRDPVTRLWSHVRMLARRASDEAGFADAALRLMARVLDGEPSGAVTRGDYATIVPRLRRAVDSRRLLVQFQDDMMSQPGLARLCGFLGIRTMPAEFGKRVYEGVPLALPEALAARARVVLRPQYEFASSLFPDLPESWRQNMVGV